MSTKKSHPSKKKLTPTQKKFLKEFPKDLNATQAAIRAGFSKKTAASQGSRMLKTLKARITKMRAGQSRQPVDGLVKRSSAETFLHALTQEATIPEENKTELARFLKRLDQLAFNDVRKMFDAHGNPIEIKDLPDDVAPSIAGFKFTEEYGSKKSEGQEGEGKVAVGYTKEFKLVNPLDAIMAYGKARNLYTDKNEKPKNALEEAATKTMVAMLAMIESQALERAREANA